MAYAEGDGPPPFPLAALLRAGAPEHLLPCGPASLEKGLTVLLERCAMAWPDVQLPASVFLPYLGARLRGAEPEAALQALRIEDLYLACAAVRGDPVALSILEQAYFSHVPRFLTSVRPSQDFIDEVCQGLREKLLCGDAPRLAEYSGRGALLGWLRVTTVRAALNLRRAKGKDPARLSGRELDLERMLGDCGDLEIDYLKEQHQEEIRRACADALSALSVEQRTLLRLNLIAGMSAERLAPILGLSRATVGRRLIAAREALRNKVLALLGERLRLSESEVHSLARVLISLVLTQVSQCLQLEEGAKGSALPLRR